MLSERSFQDHALKHAVPRPVSTFLPPLQELGSGLWTLERQFRHFGVALLPSRTTLIRLRDGSLVVISPPPLVDPSTVTAIELIGPVQYVVVPNSFHYLCASEFMKHFPAASLLAAPGLPQRVPDLDVGAELEPRPPEAWSGVLEYVVLGPVRGVSEVLFFHVATATLILTDLAFNMTRYPRSVDRLLWRLFGIPRGFGPGRTSRSLLLRDRDVASRTLARVTDWPITQIVVAHGDVVSHDARARFRTAFARFLDGSPTA